VPTKSKILGNLPGKIEFFRKIAWKNPIVFILIHDPQISNQIDAAGFEGRLAGC